MNATEAKSAAVLDFRPQGRGPVKGKVLVLTSFADRRLAFRLSRESAAALVRDLAAHFDLETAP